MTTKDLFSHIAEYGDLLKKYFDGRLSGAERHQLAQWLRSDRKNRELFERLCSSRSLGTYFNSWRQVDPDREYELLRERLGISGKKKIRHLPVRRWVAVVAWLIASSMGWYLYRADELTDTPVIYLFYLCFRKLKMVDDS